MVVGVRRHMPRRRSGHTTTVTIGAERFCLTANRRDDGSLGEVFIHWGKHGTSAAGLVSTYAVALSLGLQHQVPLADLIRPGLDQFFVPNGHTDDPEIPGCGPRSTTSPAAWPSTGCRIPSAPSRRLHAHRTCPPRQHLDRGPRARPAGRRSGGLPVPYPDVGLDVTAVIIFTVDAQGAQPGRPSATSAPADRRSSPGGARGQVRGEVQARRCPPRAHPHQPADRRGQPRPGQAEADAVRQPHHPALAGGQGRAPSRCCTRRPTPRSPMRCTTPPESGSATCPSGWTSRCGDLLGEALHEPQALRAEIAWSGHVAAVFRHRRPRRSAAF